MGQYSMFYVSCPPGVELVKLAVTMSIKRRSQIRLSPVNGLMCRVPSAEELIVSTRETRGDLRSRLVVVRARMTALKVPVSSKPGRRATREAVSFRVVDMAGLQA